MKRDGHIIEVSGMNNDTTAMVNPYHIVCLISEPYTRSDELRYDMLRFLTPSERMIVVLRREPSLFGQDSNGLIQTRHPISASLRSS